MVVPLCRCRVLYVGNAVPTVTKDGLQGIQEPLKERYPIDESVETKGIDSWLSVWSNGLLLEYIEGEKKTETAFFPVTSLHYCAAVRYVNVAGYSLEGGGERFLPLDSPFANLPDSPHPPIFAAIFRRTTGVKVLECHAFICTNAKAANALVRCCFHAYADSIYLKLDDNKIPGLKAIKEKESSRSTSPHSDIEQQQGYDEEDKQAGWSERLIGKQTWQRRQQSGDYETASISSSLAGRYRKKDPRQLTQGRSQSELGGSRSAMVPYMNGRDPRAIPSPLGRPASEMDGDGYPLGPFPPPMPPFMTAPHPGMMQPPPHMMPPPMGLPPMMAGPHPGLGMGPFGPPMHPMAMRMPPPPGPPFFGPPHPAMFGQGPMFGGPPIPPFDPGAGMNRSRSPDPGGPIITSPESVYGTMPRSSRGAFEEPVYMPGNIPQPIGRMMPPQSSYHPSAFPTEHYDAYYDSYKKRELSHSKRKPPGSTQSSRRDENESGVNQYWDAYESGIYRKPHLNEKAFSASVQNQQQNGNLSQDTEIIRPETPPADYEAAAIESRMNGMHLPSRNI